MAVKRVGIVGWRGMVGSVLLERMREEGDFDLFQADFFSTSQAGEPGPDVGQGRQALLDANDVGALRKMDAIISCQGGDYTKAMHLALRNSGFSGYWIDAASALRMEPNATLVLDPVNRAQIDRALDEGGLDFIGGNCTVSLMLMAIAGLFERKWVEWVNVATYQAASGAGARHMRELVLQMRTLVGAAGATLDDPNASILEIDRALTRALLSDDFPTQYFTAPLAANLLPFIDVKLESGKTREEWKGFAETNKILGLNPPIPVDGLCVRVGAMRCHSQAVTIKLVKDVPLDEITAAIGSSNDWVYVVENEKEPTLERLTPKSVAGTLSVGVGRLHKLEMGPEYLSLFTVGDQLLWGAAEPLRRMLGILVER